MDAHIEPQPRPAPDGTRSVVAVTPARAGCVELALECGHVVRRRFGLCVPRRLRCPACVRGDSPAPAAAAALPD